MSRPCPVSVLEPIRFLGLRPESFLIFIAGLGGLFPIYGGLISFGVGFFGALIFEKATKALPEGFVIHRFSLWAGGIDRVKWIPAPLRRVIRESFRRSWIDAGLLPAPTDQDTYEP